jgi:hypothetical protein
VKSSNRYRFYHYTNVNKSENENCGKLLVEKSHRIYVDLSPFYRKVNVMERHEIYIFSWEVEVNREKYKWFDIKNERLVENSFDLARKQCKLHQTQIYVFPIDYMGDNSVVPMHFKFDFFQTFNQSSTK